MQMVIREAKMRSLIYGNALNNNNNAGLRLNVTNALREMIYYGSLEIRNVCFGNYKHIIYI